jgi:dTDP-4-dehydrorhamnose reductase
MLAQAFLKKRPGDWDLIETDVDEFDITRDREVERRVHEIRPEIILNCAAFTRVDDCERERELAFSANALGPANLARSAKQTGARLIHFSTDYIFDGEKGAPYLEEDPPNPLNVYGESKLEGEIGIRKELDDHLIIRTQWLYGAGGNHFVKAILKRARETGSLKVVNDQIGSPTWTEDLAAATIELIQRKCNGTYHVVNSGECSWYEFAREIVRLAGLKTEIVPCTSDEFPRPARRPKYSVLSTLKLKTELGKLLPNWNIPLRSVI